MEELKNNQRPVYGSSNAVHYCGNCGERMEFGWRQGSDSPMVYVCRQCGEREAFKE